MPGSDAKNRLHGAPSAVPGLSRGEITVRPARPGDIPRMAELLADLFALESDFTPQREQQIDGLSYLLADPIGRTRVFVAEHACTVVGMASVQMLISTAEGGRVGIVEDVVVELKYRRRGIGALLLRELVDWSKQKGLRRLQLLADHDNRRALDFYHKNGWVGTNLICLRMML
ncbi:MAG: GNAT family N-acetyltransferase [Nitrospirota bacterium]|nr:GNAT family N-acetyltransferase [Nitrospirota bacterium]